MKTVAPKLSERAFQAWVVDVATRFGWHCWHVPAPMRATRQGWVGAKEGAGLPDLVMLHDDPPRLIFAECKGTGGKLSEEQRDFLARARQVAEESVGVPAQIEGDSRSPWGAIGYFPRTIGVYVWQPGLEQQIEDILRSRVLL